MIPNHWFKQSIQRLAKSISTTTPYVTYRTIQSHMLRFLVRGLNVSSAYIGQHDFDLKQLTVRNAYVDADPISTEWNSDIGQVYPETDMGGTTAWLYQDTHKLRILYTDELPDGDPEKEELEPEGVYTVVFAPLYKNKMIWGLVEIWETKYRRQWTQDELAFIEFASQYISQVITDYEV